MKLYFSPGACSLSPHIVLRESGLDFALVQVDLRTKKTKSGDDFLKINAKGYVPVLQFDDGSVLTEGSAIVQYVADRVPEKALAPPAGSMGRYRLQEWLNFVSTELHKGFSPLFAASTPDAYKPIAAENLVRRFAFVDGALAGREFLAGDHFTGADAYLFTMCQWASFLKLPMDDMAALRAWRERIAARPAVKMALQVETDARKAA